MVGERKKLLLRLDPVVYDALARWAGDELRSTNAQIEFLLRRALTDAGRAPHGAGPMRRRGRPRSQQDPAPDGSVDPDAEPSEPGARESAAENDGIGAPDAVSDG